MTRATIALIALAALGTAALADVIIYKRDGKVLEFTGIIETDGYDVVTARKAANARVETFPRAEVVQVSYANEPLGIANGLAAMDAGRFLQAIGDFREVLKDPAARDTFKQQAAFQIGMCYYSAGRRQDCIKHFQAWKPSTSVYTPEAFGLLAALLTEERDYAKARAQYDEITKLPGIPDEWKYKARLGAVRVDIAERKFDDAERTAQGIVRETRPRPDLADATALAQILMADAIWRSGKTERFDEALTRLEGATALEGTSLGTRGFLHLTRGNLLYAQGKPDEARFPYMRAALMCPDSGAEGPAYLNAGQCLLDMSARETKDQARSDMLFTDGMRLLATAAGPYGQADAAKRYRDPANKARLEALQARVD